VVLPEPDGPTNATVSPERTVSEKFTYGVGLAIRVTEGDIFESQLAAHLGNGLFSLIMFQVRRLQHLANRMDGFEPRAISGTMFVSCKTELVSELK